MRKNTAFILALSTAVSAAVIVSTILPGNSTKVAEDVNKGETIYCMYATDSSGNFILLESDVTISKDAQEIKLIKFKDKEDGSKEYKLEDHDIKKKYLPIVTKCQDETN